ncbi:hypothetical protein [Lentilactobacillus sp.]|uniref:hypothetical protein n=1 Tax=Lentilactobacillus sp. TaxID=2767931 RepID=UPI00345EACCA
MKFLGSRPTHQNVNLVKADDPTVHTKDTDQYLDKNGVNEVSATDVKDAVSKKHTQNTDQYLDFGGANQVAVGDVKDAVSKKHIHSNKDLLDTYTQTEANLADAVTKRHTQGTDTTLGTMTADIDMNSHKITNVTDPTSAQDAATKNYVDTHGIALDQVVLGSQILG